MWQAAGGTLFFVLLAAATVSSNPEILSLEKVLGYWVVTAKTAGTATVTLATQDGRTGSVTITVEPADPTASTVEYPVDLNANLEMHQEISRLANQIRRENGVPEVTVNNSLMDAAQFISGQRYPWHHTQEECDAARAYGYPHGFGTNPNKGLPGARFKVTSENGSFSREVVTGSDGTYTLRDLDASTYGIVELSPPEEYEIDNAGPQYVILPNGGNKTVTVTFTDMPVITGEGSIRKVDADDQKPIPNSVSFTGMIASPPTRPGPRYSRPGPTTLG